MYLSSLQKFILKKSIHNLKNENLSMYSDEIVKFQISESQEKNIDLVNLSIDDLLKINEKSENSFEEKKGYIEPDSDAHAHIYFYEPVIDYFKIIPKEKFRGKESKNFKSMSDSRKEFETRKRKYQRVDGNHKKGIIRGECKFLKKSKASLSRSFTSLVEKNLLRRISIINYYKKEIGIGFNLTEKGKNIIDEI